MTIDAALIGQLLQIIWINIILSGDNAVVIALACRGLPPKQRRMGIILGAGVAIGLRLIFTFLVSQLLGVPYLRIIGGLLLLWIAVKLIKGEDEEPHASEDGKAAPGTLWKAVQTVAIADLVMSLDNVLAISGIAKQAAHGDVYREIFLYVFGLVTSIPLIIAGAALIMALITRFPLFIWAGAALLGWVAGEMIVGDPALHNTVKAIEHAVPSLGRDMGVKWLIDGLGGPAHAFEYVSAAVCAAFVCLAGWILRRRAHSQGAPA